MSKIVILNSWLSFKFYSVVLVIYFCIRMIAKLTDLKQHILLLISVAQVSECSFSWVLFLQVSEAAIMVPGGVPSHVRFGWKRVCFPAQRGCLQNLVPCRLPGWGPYLLLTITPSPPCFVALFTDNTLLCCLYLANCNPSQILLQKFHLNFPNWIIVFSLKTFTLYLCSSIILPYYTVIGIIVIVSCWNWKLHENESLCFFVSFFLPFYPQKWT